jgi:hypothetical protein
MPEMYLDEGYPNDERSPGLRFTLVFSDVGAPTGTIVTARLSGITPY